MKLKRRSISMSASMFARMTVFAKGNGASVSGLLELWIEQALDAAGEPDSSRCQHCGQVIKSERKGPR